MDKNSITEIDEKHENGAGSVGAHWLDTTVQKNTMTAKSKDFHLVDFEESQSTQVNIVENKPSDSHLLSSTPALEDSNADDKSDKAQNVIIKVDQDGGKVNEDENKVLVETGESDKSGNEVNKSASSLVNNDGVDEDVVEATPPEELSMLSKRQLLGEVAPHKRKADHSDEPAIKIARSSDDDIIPETQETLIDENEDTSNLVNISVEQGIQIENVEKTANNNNNNTDNAENTESMTDESVNQESFQVLSQALESVLNDEEQVLTVENPAISKLEVKKISDNTEIDKKSESDEKQIDKLTTNEEALDKINTPNDDKVKSPSTDEGKKSRMSIEVIYDKSSAPPPKPKELVEIDEDGVKIVLDSSQEDPTLNDSDVTSDKKHVIGNHQSVEDLKQKNENIDNKLTNGNDHSKSKSDSDQTQNVSSDLAIDSDRSEDLRIGNVEVNQKLPEILNLVSDSEEDSFAHEDKSKIKIIEKEMTVLVKVKCLIHVDEVSKDITSKEVTFLSCESASDLISSRTRNSSVLNLADISDGKDSVSPSSVTSNSRPYPLNTRYSMASMVSSSSSSSSGSLKLPTKDSAQFCQPRGVPKHAKKASESHTYDDMIAEKSKKDWKNVNLITTSLLNYLNTELLTIDLHNGSTVESTNNTTENFRSSTPELPKKNSPSPKNRDKVRFTKRTRSQNIRNSSSNGLNKKMKSSPEVVDNVQEAVEEKGQIDDENESFISAASTPARQGARSLGILRNQTPVYDPSDALIGKQCFAKWGDNNYYPGVVVSKSKTKFRINFLDGLNKLLIEDFVVVMPPTLPVGLSIFAAMKDDHYGSCGIITEINKTDENEVWYTVKTDEGDKIKVSIRNIFLTTDQASILREIIDDTAKSPPTTPHLGKITLDNVVEGNRRNKSSIISTPKSTRGKSRINTLKSSPDATPSGSGVSSKTNIQPNSDTDLKTSDSNVSGTEEDELGTIQTEIIGTSSEYTAKGPQNRLKGKARSKKKIDDQETIALLGPIPEAGSTLFKGMNFILTCAPLESLDKYKMDSKVDSNSESGTDLEQEWNSIPFVRERLTTQIIAGGGTIYEKFEDIPKDQYEKTKLITNVPNITAKSLQCLSVGIPSWNHKWVIRSCLDNKLVNINQEKLPAGWSLDRKSYLEMTERSSNKPFNYIIIAIPKISGVEESTKFWKEIIENAGGIVRTIENPADNFVEATAVLTNRQCPKWIEQRAQNENIPLVSTTWIVQCLIAGEITSHETQAAYFHHYSK